MTEQPFPAILWHAGAYFFRPRLYVWKHTEKKPAPAGKEKKAETVVSAIPKISQSRLTDLAWSLDIEEKLRE